MSALPRSVTRSSSNIKADNVWKRRWLVRHMASQCFTLQFTGTLHTRSEVETVKLVALGLTVYDVQYSMEIIAECMDSFTMRHDTVQAKGDDFKTPFILNKNSIWIFLSSISSFNIDLQNNLHDGSNGFQLFGKTWHKKYQWEFVWCSLQKALGTGQSSNLASCVQRLWILHKVSLASVLTII